MLIGVGEMSKLDELGKLDGSSRLVLSRYAQVACYEASFACHL